MIDDKTDDERIAQVIRERLDLFVPALVDLSKMFRGSLGDPNADVGSLLETAMAPLRDRLEEADRLTSQSAELWDLWGMPEREAQLGQTTSVLAQVAISALLSHMVAGEIWGAIMEIRQQEA